MTSFGLLRKYVSLIFHCELYLRHTGKGDEILMGNKKNGSQKNDNSKQHSTIWKFPCSAASTHYHVYSGTSSMGAPNDFEACDWAVGDSQDIINFLQEDNYNHSVNFIIECRIKILKVILRDKNHMHDKILIHNNWKGLERFHRNESKMGENKNELKFCFGWILDKRKIVRFKSNDDIKTCAESKGPQYDTDPPAWQSDSSRRISITCCSCC